MSPVDVLAVSICCKAVWEKFHISYRKGFGYRDAISMFLLALVRVCVGGVYMRDMWQEQQMNELFLCLQGAREYLDADVCLVG